MQRKYCEPGPLILKSIAMRAELLDPLYANRDLQATMLLAEEIYQLHEAGADYSEKLNDLSRKIGHIVSRYEVCSAFGSTNSETFARDLLIARKPIPSNLTRAEMLEMVERVCASNGSESNIKYWLSCLRLNTGDERISDLIFWPGDYFGDDDNSRVMTPAAIIDTALAGGESKR